MEEGLSQPCASLSSSILYSRKAPHLKVSEYTWLQESAHITLQKAGKLVDDFSVPWKNTGIQFISSSIIIYWLYQFLFAS